MKLLFLASFFVLTIFSSYAQSYWQQEVNYKIQVKLDDVNHMLSGYEEFEYINNSPNSLDRIYIHLWPKHGVWLAKVFRWLLLKMYISCN